MAEFASASSFWTPVMRLAAMHAWAPAIVLLLAAAASQAAEKLPLTELRIGPHKVVAETAATEPSRSLGLMHRKQPLGDNRGMLFVFEASGFHSMWMQNTYIPLSVAFINDRGVILNIADMTPLTTTPHTAAGFARYALEMNQGWFASRGIKAGATVEGLRPGPSSK
jgi:uncharacterized membrane protein (UPF0127 family)